MSSVWKVNDTIIWPAAEVSKFDFRMVIRSLACTSVQGIKLVNIFLPFAHNLVLTLT